MEVNKVYNNDCFNITAQMPDDYCDLTVTSPPYNFNAGSGLGTKYNNKFKDNLSQEQYFDWSVKVITECMRVSKLVAWNIQLLAGNKEALLKYIGYFHKEIREVLIWDKQYSEPAMNEGVLNSEFEFILLFDKNGGGRKIEQAQFGRGAVSNIIRQNKSKNSIKSQNKQDNHFAVFPDAIPDKLINYFSKEGDIIFEPFAGSGTTALSAIKYNRKFIACELVKEYFDIAEERIKASLGQYKLF
jgi:site-specific DNA-methyltransferase (adenine-specific)